MGDMVKLIGLCIVLALITGNILGGGHSTKTDTPLMTYYKSHPDQYFKDMEIEDYNYKLKQNIQSEIDRKKAGF